MAIKDFEFAYAASRALGAVRPTVPITPYLPAHRETPSRRLEIFSAWTGLETVIADIIATFHLGTERCLEFGVENAFSTVALSSYFASVTGVDTFQGDIHTTILKDSYNTACANTAPYSNIKLIRSDYRDYIKTADQSILYDLIHVDIIHTFADTYACGLWSARHSTCTIFHDTESFPAVKQAVSDLARTTGKKFYNFIEFHGLGILV
jgi:hypothetical protein